MGARDDKDQNSVSFMRKIAAARRKNPRVTAYFFNNTILNQGSCGPGSDRTGFKQFLINKDQQHGYRVTVVSTWINAQTGALESYTKIYTSEAGGEINLGCNYQNMAGNGATRITRKITREVRVDPEIKTTE